MNFIGPYFRVIVFVYLFTNCTHGFSQNTTVDSLLLLVNQSKANAETYNQLALEHWFININKSKKFAEKALLLANEEQDSAQIGFAYNRLGTAYLYLGNLDSAQIFYEISAAVFKEMQMYTAFGGATACCAKIYESRFQYDKAIEEYQKCFGIFEKLEVSEYYVQALIVVGNLYSKLGKYNDTKSYFDKALKHQALLKDYDLIMLYNYVGINYQNIGDFNNAIHFFDMAFHKCDLSDSNIALATTFVNTGNLYVAWDKKEAALQYFKKGLNLAIDAGIVKNITTILPLIGDIYLEWGDLSKAGDYYNQVLDYSDDSKDIFNEARAYNGLAKIFANRENVKQAINYSLMALNLFYEVKRPFYLADTHYLLASNYLLIHDFVNAKQHIDKANNIAIKNTYRDLEADVALLYARYFCTTNMVSKSPRYYEKHITIKDSIFADKNQELLAKYQVEFDNLEKDLKIKESEHINALNKIELSQRKRQVTYSAIISLLLLVVVVVLSMMYVKKQKANRLLFLKNKELLKHENKRLKNGESVEISQSLQNNIIAKLEKELNKNKIHLRNDLTLYSLSKILETNSSYLSKIIKTHYNSSFSTLLNKHRIIEAQKMILDKNFNQYTIDAISMECGYNSKSTFNKAFKEITGLTPKEYKRQNFL